jgi:hypothetical protein
VRQRSRGGIGDQVSADRLADGPPRDEPVELELGAGLVLDRRVADGDGARPVGGEGGEQLAQQRSPVGVIGLVGEPEGLVAEGRIDQLGTKEARGRDRLLRRAALARLVGQLAAQQRQIDP